MAIKEQTKSHKGTKSKGKGENKMKLLHSYTCLLKASIPISELLRRTRVPFSRSISLEDPPLALLTNESYEREIKNMNIEWVTNQ